MSTWIFCNWNNSGPVYLNIEPIESFWRDKCIMPTCGEFCNFSCNDRTGKESCLGPEGDFGGDTAAFPDWPSKLKGGTISIRPTLCGPKSGLYSSGLDGKLPVNRGDVNGVGNVVAGIVFTIPEIPCIRDNRIPLREQNDSSARAWCTVLPESGLCEASTSSTFRLQPREGPFTSSTAEGRFYGKKSTHKDNILLKPLAIKNILLKPITENQCLYLNLTPLTWGNAEFLYSLTTSHHFGKEEAVAHRHSWRHENYFGCIPGQKLPTSARQLDQSHPVPYHNAHQLQWQAM